jgi:dTDP-4-dehydrorhamnose 3,5-epimerase
VPTVPFSVDETALAGLYIIEMKQVSDERGILRELFRTSDFEAAGVPVPGFVQANLTRSHRGVVRGLHGEPMTKFVTVIVGSAFGAYADARSTSPTFGEVATVELTPGRAVIVPTGVCNGFQATADGWTEYAYCFDREWEPTIGAVAVNAFDPALAIDWPITIDRTDRALLSEKDASLPVLAEAVAP